MALILIIFCSLSLSAQDCNEELLLQKPGNWKAGVQGSIYNVSAANLAKEKAVLSNIHKMIYGSYKPMGCQVDYSMAYGKIIDEGQTWIADPYHYAMYLLPYRCDPVSADKSKYYTDVSSATHVNITANVIFFTNTLYATNIATDDFRGYLKLKQRPIKKDGYYYLGEEVTGDSERENMIKEYSWLITYNDTLPFSFISRKEYLIIQKKRLGKDIKDNPGEEKYYNEYLNKINQYLQNPESELNLPAVCMWNDEEMFEGFVQEETKGSFIAIKPNLNYYHKKLALSAPQFFTVVCQLPEADPMSVENIAAIKEAVDFAKLRSMLGK